MDRRQLLGGGGMKRFVLLVGLVGMSAASAQTMYKCQSNGKIEYSDKPCTTGNEVKRIAPNGGPTAEDRGRAMMRLQAERARFDAQDAAAAQERAQGRARFADADTKRNKDAASAQAAKEEDEKHGVHSKDGWDRKPQGQIDAEEAAKHGLPAPPSAKGATWRDENAAIHGRTGWDVQKRGATADAAPAKEYRREQARVQAAANPSADIASCDSGGCVDTLGRYYAGSGTTLMRVDGKVCQRTGQSVTCN